MEKAFRYRFYPTPEQETLLRQTVGCVRLVYNRALAMRTEAFYHEQKRIGYLETSAALTRWKKQDDLAFLKDVSSVPLQQTLRHLQTAFTNFFEKRAKYPNFKKKRNGGSATFTKSAFSLKDGQVFMAKSDEPLNLKWSRQLPRNAQPSSMTIRLTPSGKWFVSILCDVKILSKPKSTQQVGLDMGISSLVTTSNGEKFENPKSLRKAQKKLRRLNKSLARKQKGSNNRRKARLQLAKQHEKIANIRKDNLHKITTQLVRENQVIAVETLNVKGMLGNHKLAQAISDASWGEALRQLEYKSNWYGRDLAQIDQWFPSSKRCSSCGRILSKLPLQVREWDCPSCNAHHDRDENAGKNILAVGLTVLACGATVRPKSSKDGGKCDEAGSNSSDAVVNRRRRKSFEESPQFKTAEL
ncbi:MULTISPECIES: RNA-guided endonuclease InsQ/TnpB family protein [Leptolyngbya]|uniref:RNA-guided endonuclease InsQ/TnpB family protein n=1 Tax=Leptolyngbya TaxID=47251 RepID=UPI001684BCA0|nr:RNA-guided endonuclease TnpB family protein [Leptolyngbya sp. FACHB-1624]MBD1854807.1 IS200/IS605 family element transposase accessory protein TnpB [Leptolyngbya sp. FACHB-1624]